MWMGQKGSDGHVGSAATHTSVAALPTCPIEFFLFFVYFTMPIITKKNIGPRKFGAGAVDYVDPLNNRPWGW